jgi:hypothetical protein
MQAAMQFRDVAASMHGNVELLDFSDSDQPELTDISVDLHYFATASHSLIKATERRITLLAAPLGGKVRWNISGPAMAGWVVLAPARD